MTTITSAGFQEAIKEYLKRNDSTIATLAQRIGKSDRTVGDWIRLGIKRDDYRQKIVDEYPWLFNQNESGQIAVPVRVSEADTARQNLLVLLKTEHARPALGNLTAILVWFLFKASAEDRNQFRDMLGDDWKQFLELTRAMTNETAFEVTKNEGRLEWCQ
jgi:hypothetical protein